MAAAPLRAAAEMAEMAAMAAMGGLQHGLVRARVAQAGRPDIAATVAMALLAMVRVLLVRQAPEVAAAAVLVPGATEVV